MNRFCVTGSGFEGLGDKPVLKLPFGDTPPPPPPLGMATYLGYLAFLN